MSEFIRDAERARLIATVGAVKEADGNVKLAAAGLKIHPSQVRRRLKRAGDLGLNTGALRPAPIGRTLGKVTTQVGPDGRVERQWLREHPEGDLPPEELAQIMREALADLPALPAVPIPPVDPSPDLLTLLPLADLHNGMRAWAPETGESWDLEIADRVLRPAFSEAIARSPDAAEFQILGLGDITHADNDLNQTPGHGHRLDAEGRHRKTIKMTLALLVDLVRQALGRFPVVSVRLLQGNHDGQTAAALSVALDFIFADDPRVIVDDSPSLWWWREWGLVFLGASHSHTIKAEAMPGVMAADNPAAWGRTRHRYIWRGHHHNKNAVEVMGVPVECLRAPIPKDAYHAGLHHRSGRSVQSITYHRDYGEHSRAVVNLLSQKESGR